MLERNSKKPYLISINSFQFLECTEVVNGDFQLLSTQANIGRRKNFQLKMKNVRFEEIYFVAKFTRE